MIRLHDTRDRAVGTMIIALIAGAGFAIASRQYAIGLSALTAACALAVIACFRAGKRARTDRADDAATERLADAYRASIEALASAIAAKDSYSPPHIARVQRICELVARRIGLDDHAVQGIRIAAMLQDVGKLGVPDYILLKPGPLEAEEFTQVSNHAAIGARILEQVDFPWDIARLLRHHHERYDGSGYPDHLAGERIPLGSRIIAVAAVYEGLICRRCHKDRWSHHRAVEHISRLAGSHFDPRIVDAFLAVEPEIAEMTHSMQPDHEAPSHDFAAADLIAAANRELVSLFEIAQTLSTTLEIDEVLALLAHRNRRLLQAASCAVFLLDESAPRTLVARIAVGRHQDALRGARAQLGSGVTGRCAATKTPHLGAFDSRDLTFPDDSLPALDLRSCASVPILTPTEVLGAINVYDTAADAFSEDDLRLLSLVAQQAALAVRNARAFERVRDSAMRDPLTSLHNGRYLRHAIEQELSRAARHGEPVSLVELDLDNFKAVNDSCGHRAGDTVLMDVAAIMLAEVRDYDVVARIGGDEFVVLLPGTPASEARLTAERIRQAISRYAESTPAPDLGLGASVGIASFPEDAEDMEQLLARADAAMYRHKRARKQGHLAA